MSDFVTPQVVVSKCFFAPCRYDGQQVKESFIEHLANFVDLIPVCPEVEIGLGVPRSTIRLVQTSNRLQLSQPETGQDLTDRMIEFSQDFLASIDSVDGFILKNRSPSCGTKDSKVYAPDSDQVIGRSAGFFTQQVQEVMPQAVVTNEGRLKNFSLRKDFLTELFLLARFRKVKEANSIGQLVEFQSQNKYLLLAYDEELVRKLGRIAANPKEKSTSAVIADYERCLQQIIDKNPSYKANINALMHAFGHASDYLTAEEKEFFLNSLDRYRNNKVPLSVPVNILKSWVIKYQIDYLQQQTFLAPYPEGLVEIKDSGMGRDL